MEYKNVWETTSRTVQTSTNGAHTNTKEYFQTGLETDGNTKLKNQISGDENNKVGRGLNHTGSGPNGRSQNENLEIGVASKPRSQKFNQGVLEGRSDLGQDGNKKTDIYNSEAGQEKRKGDETPVSALGQDECTKICLASNEVGQTVSQEGAKGGSQVSKNECQNEAGQTSAPNENAVQKNEGHHGGPEGGLDPQGKFLPSPNSIIFAKRGESTHGYKWNTKMYGDDIPNGTNEYKRSTHEYKGIPRVALTRFTR